MGDKAVSRTPYFFCFLMVYFLSLGMKQSNDAVLEIEEMEVVGDAAGMTNMGEVGGVPLSPTSPPHCDSESSTQPELNSFHTSSATPTQSAAPPPQSGNGHLHQVIAIMREQQLGKATLGFAISIATAIFTSTKENAAKWATSLILIVLLLGYTAVWNGILFKNTLPRYAQVVEALGIGLVFISFNGLVASLLPVEFLWVPTLCCALYLLPFIIAARRHGSS